MIDQCLNVVIPSSRTQYDIEIGHDNLNQLPNRLKTIGIGKKILIITDKNVDTLYGQTLEDFLSAEGFSVKRVILAAGESSKSITSAQTIYQNAIDFNLTRNDAILALGGGVIGDLAGYCAATYMRGTQFIQVPTTLLAQVDSSVGGKVAINLPSLKNGVGCFYQPHLVWMDLSMLESLPQREFLAGLAEVLKYTLIETSCAQTSGMFDWLYQNAHQIKTILPELIYRCCSIKAAVVSQDEHDTKGLRAFLNLGHTFAHAYEEITDYQTYLHGEAVAIGMIDAFNLAIEKSLIDSKSKDRVLNLYQLLGLNPNPLETYNPETLKALMQHDKKNTGNGIKFVLPRQQLGQVELLDVQ